LLSEGGSDQHRHPLHTAVDMTHTFCGPTEDETICACGCTAYDARCPLYLKHYHHGLTQVPESHICCKIPGRD
jgi:hypothetical protein